MKVENEKLARSLVQEIQQILADLPEDIRLTEFEMRDWELLGKQSVTFNIKFGTHGMVRVNFDRKLEKKS